VPIIKDQYMCNYINSQHSSIKINIIKKSCNKTVIYFLCMLIWKYVKCLQWINHLFTVKFSTIIIKELLSFQSLSAIIFRIVILILQW